MLLLGEKMLEKNGISVIQLLQRQRKESSCTKTSELWYPSPPFWKFFKKLPTYSTITPPTYFFNPSLCDPSICSVFASFIVQTALSIQLGFSTQ